MVRRGTTRSPKTVRPPQQSRSRKTRARLLEAAIECLVEHGWAGTTMMVIAERAGVSRGASQHHFRTREELVTAAVQYVGDVRFAELRARTEESGKRRTRAVLESLADFYASPVFVAALHVWVAASSDPKLRALVVGLEAQVGREVHRMVVELLSADERRPGVREAVQATCDLARGLGLANLLADDGARRKRVLRQWATMLDRVLLAR